VRVIAGKYKGRAVLAPRGYELRPTADKVKGAIFSMLAAEVPDAMVLDVFSGTGNLGIEALSRGALSCVFVDSSKESTNVLRENLSHIKIGDEAKILPYDWNRALDVLSGSKFDILFADPPYETAPYDELMKKLLACDIMSGQGAVVLESSFRMPPGESYEGFEFDRQRRYGKTLITIFRRVI
jgi:16S rRNA (guanine(966)-N(2))-methyltransferase RsmD